jgi:hypothetical protein
MALSVASSPQWWRAAAAASTRVARSAGLAQATTLAVIVSREVISLAVFDGCSLRDGFIQEPGLGLVTGVLACHPTTLQAREFDIGLGSFVLNRGWSKV